MHMGLGTRRSLHRYGQHQRTEHDKRVDGKREDLDADSRLQPQLRSHVHAAAAKRRRLHPGGDGIALCSDGFQLCRELLVASLQRPEHAVIARAGVLRCC